MYIAYNTYIKNFALSLEQKPQKAPQQNPHKNPNDKSQSVIFFRIRQIVSFFEVKILLVS